MKKTTKTQVITSPTTRKESVRMENTSNDIMQEEGEILQDVQDQQKSLQKEDEYKIVQNDDNVNDIQDILKKNNVAKKKNLLKKNKKSETDKLNISVKSSFSKFDALQKRNLIHVRSLDASTAQEKFSNPQGEVQTNCRLCDKPVYKMEEVKAEKSIYHKNCFRCHECKKQLKVDTYQSHEGILYCTVHFKLLFSPKCVEDDENEQPRKPELIIRENQPTELPPDVVRASDKLDLGLEELKQLNVRSRFQVFQQGKNGSNENEQDKHKTKICNDNVLKQSASILSKIAKLQQLSASGTRQPESCVSSHNDDDDDDDEDDEENEDFDLRQKKCEQKRERPIGIGEAMNDIRTLFEKGHCVTKEERREERKQEIQNIRSRLFMGKQARIKEMYQQAVAESEHAAEKKPNIDIEVDSKSLRERFEACQANKDNSSANETNGDIIRKGAIEKEGDVFASAISKKSRSIFMELDANLINGKHPNILPIQSSTRCLQHQKLSSSIGCQSKVHELDNDVVKCSEAVEDVIIQTSEISEKFKFFETYHPTENKKKVFRITPPREGVVKMPSPDENLDEKETTKEVSPDRYIIAHSRTTSMILNKFREMEKNQNRNASNGPKPLKCFTPPPDGNRRLYVEQDSDECDSSDNDDENEDDDDEEDEGSGASDEDHHSHFLKVDEALKEVQQAARAKQLRLKFEKWQANEIKHEKNDEQHHHNIYANNDLDDSGIESTQTIRNRFENMRSEKQSQLTRPRYQVNRFV